MALTRHKLRSADAASIPLACEVCRERQVASLVVNFIFACDSCAKRIATALWLPRMKRIIFGVSRPVSWRISCRIAFSPSCSAHFRLRSSVRRKGRPDTEGEGDRVAWNIWSDRNVTAVVDVEIRWSAGWREPPRRHYSVRHCSGRRHDSDPDSCIPSHLAS
jgi:hypothetical protein